MKRIDLDDLPPRLAALLTGVEEGEELLLVQNGAVAGRLTGGVRERAPGAEAPASEDEAKEIFEQFRSIMEDEF
ncbi:MAG: hypothetical protein JWQ29_1483 [Phenylobacterium sp.]|nr:hypothetical protein [Phenylobacterium sp.]